MSWSGDHGGPGRLAAIVAAAGIVAGIVGAECKAAAPESGASASPDGRTLYVTGESDFGNSGGFATIAYRARDRRAVSASHRANALASEVRKNG